MKLTENQKKTIKSKLKSLVMEVLNEETGRVPSKTSFTIANSFKQIRRMMEMLELQIKDNQFTTQDYQNTMNAIREKLDQMDNTLKLK